jgi:hypothetical protein
MWMTECKIKQDSIKQHPFDIQYPLFSIFKVFAADEILEFLYCFVDFAG